MMSSNPGALLPLLVAWPLVAAGLAGSPPAMESKASAAS